MAGEKECCAGCVVALVVIALLGFMGFSSLEYNEYGLDYSSWSKTVPAT
jgi:hypothetical protein